MLEKASGGDDLRLRAAEAALAEVASGMKLGLGSGRTAEHFVRLLGEKVRGGLKIVGVPTSERTARLAIEEGVPLTTLDDEPRLDLVVDGADEIDPQLRLIKGGGGAMLREKIVATAATLELRPGLNSLDGLPSRPRHARRRPRTNGCRPKRPARARRQSAPRHRGAHPSPKL